MTKISKIKYDYLIESHKIGKYANHICDVRCGLGKEKTFQVENTDKKIIMRCTQIGGFFTG